MLSIIMIFSALVLAPHTAYSKKSGPLFSVWAVAGERAQLPCPTASNLPLRDDPVIILWFRGKDGAPIYSYDARTTEFTSGVRWHREQVLGQRSYFVAKAEPPALVLNPVLLEDEGIYTCRVEYPVGGSVTNRVNLTLVVPSPTPTVLWQGHEVGSWVGPVSEGSYVDLVCRVQGGRPPPSLTWWHQERRLEGQQETRTPPHHLPHSGVFEDAWMVESRVSMVATRDLYNTPLSCHAHTQVPPTYLPQLPPATATVRFNVTLPVVEVEVSGGDGPISAGKIVRLKCRAWGSQPPAIIAWHVRGQHLPKATSSVSPSGNVTTSSVSFTVDRDFDGAMVSCTATNDLLQQNLNRSIVLTVFYPPVVSLQLGGPLQGQELKEGDDVFFECNIRSNPLYQRVTWSHNGEVVWHNVSLGIVISGLSMAVRSLKRMHSGAYSCTATNSAGTTASDPQYITVRHTPVCAGGSRHSTQGAARGEPSTVTCRVEAEPDGILSWRWSVLHDDMTEMDFPDTRVRTEENSLVSSITITPSRPEDYGRLACRSRNSIGWQRKPCVVTLVAAGPPDTPINCTVHIDDNDSQNEVDYEDDVASNQGVSISVTCIDGYNGGLPQRFMLEALQNNHSLTNLTSDFPEWMVGGLASGTGVTLKMFAFNARGQSEVIRKEVHTPMAEPRTTRGSSLGTVSPLLGALLGAVIVLVLLLIVVILVARHSCKKKSKQSSSSNHSHKLVTMSALAQDERDDPDVVSSIQRRHPSLDVLATAGRVPHSQHIENNNGQAPRTSSTSTLLQAPRTSSYGMVNVLSEMDTLSSSETDSECNSIVDLTASGKASVSLSRNQRSSIGSSGSGYSAVAQEFSQRTNSLQRRDRRSEERPLSPNHYGKDMRSGDIYNNVVPVQVISSSVKPVSPIRERQGAQYSLVGTDNMAIGVRIPQTTNILQNNHQNRHNRESPPHAFMTEPMLEKKNNVADLNNPKSIIKNKNYNSYNDNCNEYVPQPKMVQAVIESPFSNPKFPNNTLQSPLDEESAPPKPPRSGSHYPETGYLRPPYKKTQAYEPKQGSNGPYDETSLGHINPHDIPHRESSI